MNTVRGNDGHRSMCKVPLKRATEIVVRTHNCGAGENRGVEIVIGSGRRARSAWRRMGQVGQTELFGHGVCDINVRRVARLQVAVDSLDDGAEDGIISRQRNRLI
jgi:hypothetical protein